MKLSSHLSLTAPVAGLTAWQAGWEPMVWLYAGAVLIDLDHYLYFALHTGRISPVEMFTWYEDADRQCTLDSYYGLNVLHAAEPFIILAMATHIWPMLSWLLLGMGFHMLLDLIWLYRHPNISVKVRAYSWIEHLIRLRRGEREFWR